jgi:fatty-acyl-CoA synthase
VLVPLNTFAPAHEIDYVLEHADVAVLLMQRSLASHRYLDDLLAAHPGLATAAPGGLLDPALPRLRRVVCMGAGDSGAVESWDGFLSRGHTVPDALLDAVAAAVQPQDDAVIIYTSGTSARPKGVLHMHRAPCLQSWRWAAQQRLDPSHRIWTSFPFFWSAGFAMIAGAAVAAGACLVLEELFEPATVLELIERERVTYAVSTLHQESALADHPDAARRDLRSLRQTRPGSALRRFAGPEWISTEVDAAFGLTETFTGVTACPLGTDEAIRTRTHGRAMPGSVVRILDPATGEPLPAGEEGEIAVGGTTLMRGYHKEPDAGRIDAQGLFHTGDLGVIDEHGWLHWHGRLSRMIKTGGANVSPTEIEDELAAWGELALAVVVGVPDPELGESVVLCAVPREGHPVTEEEVRAHLRTRLSTYKVPRTVLFISESDIAFTGSEKVRLDSMRAFAAERIARLRDGGGEAGSR